MFLWVGLRIIALHYLVETFLSCEWNIYHVCNKYALHQSSVYFVASLLEKYIQ